MWEQIGAAAIYGAIGGGFGALIGSLLAAPVHDTKYGSMIMSAMALLGAIVGYNIAEPLLKPHIGQYLPAPSAADSLDAQIDAALDELNELPTFAAILKRDPEMRDALKRQLRKVGEEANNSIAARQMAFSASFNEVSGRYIYYLKRGRDEDILAIFRDTNENLEYLSSTDPKFCFDSSYNPAALATLDMEAIRSKYAEGRFDQSQELGARMVENAYDEIPAYDVAAAQAALERAVGVLRVALGDENLGMLSGTQAVATLEDYKLVCDATIAVNNSLLNEAVPAEAIRHVFTLSG